MFISMVEKAGEMGFEEVQKSASKSLKEIEDEELADQTVI
jgi:hypothetical protein